MALFKLISDGILTYMELDGKTINSACVQNISFNHDVRNGERNVSLHLDLDLQKAHISSENGICGIFENDSTFKFACERMYRHEKELQEKKRTNATIMYKALNEMMQDGE